MDHRAMSRRNLTDRLIEALADTPTVLVNGARQVGKSTLVQARKWRKTAAITSPWTTLG